MRSSKREVNFYYFIKLALMQENKKIYTTGDVAKLCNVSILTVQFYDKEEIVQPSEISEGGRRIYIQSDLEKFRLACFYKNLGFSLKEIKNIVDSEEEYTVILDLLHEQQVKIENKIKNLTVVKEKLFVLQDEFKSHSMPGISSEEELNNVLFKKEKHRKTDIMTYIFIGCYIVTLIVGFLLTTKVGGFHVNNYLQIAITN